LNEEVAVRKPTESKGKAIHIPRDSVCR